MADIISFPGEINVNKAWLVSSTGSVIDISAMIADITLFEDIFSNTMSGHLLLEDALDLVATLPLLGQELFKLELQTPTLTSKIEKTFYVYKMQHRTAKKRVQMYMLNFCSIELITSTNSKVSRAFDGNIGDIVKTVFTDNRYIASSSKLNIERPKNSYKFIAPFWSPFETINWLTGKSINPVGVPNYLLYENNKNFEYISVDTLIKQPAIRSFTFSDVDANTYASATGDMDSKYNIVKSMDTDTTFDYLRNLQSGMLSGKLYTFDMTTRSAAGSTFDYLTDFDKSSHLEKYPLKTSDMIKKKVASLYFIEKNNFQSGKYVPVQYRDFFLQRNSLMEQLSAFKICIQVNGRTDIKAGDTINYRMNDFREILPQEMNQTSAVSDYYSGKYLVTAIRHQILSGVHSMYMEIISDSFIKPLIVKP